MAGIKQTRKVVTFRSGEKYLFTSATDAKTPDATTKLLVSEVEQLTGVSKSKLRRYEDAGILCPERTGEGVANNRKLYGVEDLRRLQAITALREYDFSLPEIGPILDEEIDLYDALSEKLIELKRRENQLHNLGLFAHFAEATGSDLIESLGCGPTELDALANLARSTAPYEAALAQLETYSDDEAEHAFVDLDKLLLVFPYIDKNDTYAPLSELTDHFITWWNEFVWPMSDLGYLGFWALYEDHTLIPERVQLTAGSDYVGFLEMFVFFTCMMDLLDEQSSRLKLIAKTSNEDVVVAAEEIDKLSYKIAQALIGNDAANDLPEEMRFILSMFTLGVMNAFIQDRVLSSYLGILDGHEGLPNTDEIERAMDMLTILGGDEAGA